MPPVKSLNPKKNHMQQGLAPACLLWQQLPLERRVGRGKRCGSLKQRPEESPVLYETKAKSICSGVSWDLLFSAGEALGTEGSTAVKSGGGKKGFV